MLDMDLYLKPLDLKDIKMVFAWRNDPKIVKLSSSQKKVTWEEHKAWIKNSIHNPQRKVYIIYSGTTALGQVRFDRIEKTSTAAISVYLLNEFTGKGYGVKSIQLATDSIFKLWADLTEIYAFVRKSNLASQKAFEKSGFTISTNEVDRIENHLSFRITNYAQKPI